jgi:hypothetical protein
MFHKFPLRDTIDIPDAKCQGKITRYGAFLPCGTGAYSRWGALDGLIRSTAEKFVTLYNLKDINVLKTNN